MRKRSRVVLVGICVASTLACLAPSKGFAQTGARRSPSEAGQGEPDFSAREIQRLFDAYVVMQAQERLALTDAQYPKFLARLRSLQDTRRRNQQERLQLVQDLNRLVASDTRIDDQTVRERLRALQEQESRSAAELRKAYDALDEVLEVRQQARFRVFEELMERRKLQLLLRARQGARAGSRPRAGRPPV